MAALVLALTILAASPLTHDLVHKSDAPRVDDRCAVVLFAAGVSQPLEPITVPLPEIAWQVAPAFSAEEIFLSSPRFLRLPERGPPTRSIS